MEKTIEYWNQRAEQIATVAHANQTRRDGSPYLPHPARVAAALELRLKPIGWLHDVVEDTDVTLDDLRREGFPKYVIDALALLTHGAGVPNEIYWTAIATNEDAIRVKLVDINDNLSDKPNERQKAKYARALAVFKAAGYSL